MLHVVESGKFVPRVAYKYLFEKMKEPSLRVWETITPTGGVK